MGKIVDTSNLRGDFFGGLTAGVVALPLALAFGVQSGMGAIAGLYGAIMIGMIAAWFGGTDTQISGPTGPMTVVSAVVIASAVDAHGGRMEDALGTIIAIFLLAGLLQILLGVFRIGHYIKYMPYPVVSGFMSGIGIIIIVLQIFPFLGHSSPKKIPEIFTSLPDILDQVNYASVCLALATIAIIYLFPKITKLIPSALAALVALTVASTILELDVKIIGDIPEGLPVLQLSSLSNVDWGRPMLLLIPALTLAALGTIDSLLTSIVADNMTRTQHSSNKELVGQGLGNMAAAVIGGIPGAGATMRTVVNINSGGRTRLSGVIHGLALLIVLLGAGAYARLIPLPVLAGILITVGIGIVNYKAIKHIPYVPLADSLIMLVVIILTVFVDLLQAVAVGMVLACVLFMKKMSDIVDDQVRDGLVGDNLDDADNPVDLTVPEEVRQQVYVKYFDGPIFFGFSSRFPEMLRDVPSVKVIVLRMDRVPYIDQSGIYSIEDLILGLQEKNVHVYFSGLQKQPNEMLKNIALIPRLVPSNRVYSDFRVCMEAVKESL